MNNAANTPARYAKDFTLLMQANAAGRRGITELERGYKAASERLLNAGLLHIKWGHHTNKLVISPAGRREAVFLLS